MAKEPTVLESSERMVPLTALSVRERTGWASTVRLTGMVCGVFEAEESITVIVPEYDPADRPEVLNVTVMASDPDDRLPDAGEHVSHVMLSVMR